MSNFFKKLFKGRSKRCCNVKIEEVKTEDQSTGQSNTSKTNKYDSCCRKEK